MPFEIGQKVQLKSGGAIMVVDGLSEERILCTWYAEDGERGQEWIREIDLRAIEPAVSSRWESYVEFDPTEDPF